MNQNQQQPDQPLNSDFIKSLNLGGDDDEKPNDNQTSNLKNPMKKRSSAME